MKRRLAQNSASTSPIFRVDGRHWQRMVSVAPLRTATPPENFAHWFPFPAPRRSGGCLSSQHRACVDRPRDTPPGTHELEAKPKPKNHVHFIVRILIPRSLSGLQRFHILLTSLLPPQKLSDALHPFPASCNSPCFRYSANSRSRPCLFLSRT